MNVSISFSMNIRETDDDAVPQDELGSASGLVNLDAELLGADQTKQFMVWLLANTHRLMLNEALEATGGTPVKVEQLVLKG